MHMGIPVCKRAGIAKKFAFGDPITHNKIVRIWGLIYIYGRCAQIPAIFENLIPRPEEKKDIFTDTPIFDD